MLTRLGALLLLALLGLVFFADLVLHPTQVLYSDYSDLVSLHLPSRHFLVASWQQTGELPLWCPYSFAGMPFIHDIQVSAFYPLHWPLLLLSPDHVGAALSWLVVLHIILAGWTMYAFARRRGLNETGALVAALGYMFANKWLAHILTGGHYNMVPLAWLPLVLLWLEQAIRSGAVGAALVRATWAGAAYALLILCAYPYVTLYAGLFIGLWTLGTALEQAGYLGGDGPRKGRRTAAALLRWLGLGAWTLLVAVALGAVQLLPSLEAAGQASRSLGVPFTTESLLGGLRSLAALVGPPLTSNPNWLIEDRTGLGLLWLTLALLALRLCPGQARFPGIVCLLLFLFALLGAAAVQSLPGFRLFQLPSRILLLLPLPLSLMAGAAVQALLSEPGPSDDQRRDCRSLLLKLTAAVLLLGGVLALGMRRQGQELQLGQSYWLSLLLTVPAAWWLLGRPAGRRERLAWVVLLLADLWALSWPLVAVRPEAALYEPSQCVHYLETGRGAHARTLDFPPADCSANCTPLWPGLPMVREVEPVRGFNPIDVLRYKEYLQLITDQDGPLRPLDRMFTSAVLGSFPVRNARLAELLGIRYLLQPAELPVEAIVLDASRRGSWKRQRDGDDPAPVAFNFIANLPTGWDSGFQELPPYGVYETPMCCRALSWCRVPRRCRTGRSSATCSAPPTFGSRCSWKTGYPRQAALRPEPAIGRRGFGPISPTAWRWKLKELRAGYLVLTDIWFPGWTCTVNEQPVPLYRANYLFRAVEVGPGNQRVVFTFAPASYFWGRLISGTAVLLLLGMSLLLLVRQLSSER